MARKFQRQLDCALRRGSGPRNLGGRHSPQGSHDNQRQQGEGDEQDEYPEHATIMPGPALASRLQGAASCRRFVNVTRREAYVRDPQLELRNLLKRFVEELHFLEEAVLAKRRVCYRQ